jgi:glycosyltransferase involved in cell wall biosynthesis
MIVKNESHVLEGLLRSVAPLIDTWTIVDTGSTDGTPDLIARIMAELDIPGNLYHRPWINFGANRTEALDLARGTAAYHWVIDADDLIVGNLQFPELVHASYHLRYGKEFTYLRQQLFRDDLNWRYEGVLHEYPTCDREIECGTIIGDYHIVSRRLGARSQDPDKYKKDALVLEEALKDEPHNPRYWFYLGQSYYDAGEFDKALTAYSHRAGMQGWAEELFYSQMRVGLCCERLNKPISEITLPLLEAWRIRPFRAESLYHLSRILRLREQYDVAVIFARHALLVPFPSDALFVDASCYDYRIADEFSVSAYYSKIDNVAREGYQTCQKLAERDDIPDDIRNRAIGNLEWYRRRFGVD